MSPASKSVLEELSRLRQQLSPAVELATVPAAPLADVERNNDDTEVNEKEDLKHQEAIPVEQNKMPAWKLLCK